MLKIAACQDQIAKGRSLGIKCACVSLLDINIDGFTSSKLFLHRRCMTAFRYEIPRKFILPVKNFFFSAGSGVEKKNLQRSEQAHFLVSRLRSTVSLLTG